MPETNTAYMKKIRLIMLASAILLFAACTKDGSDPVIPKNSWTLNSTQHLVVGSSRSSVSGSTDATIIYKDGSNEAVTLGFKALPTANATYELVEAGTSLSDNQCHLSVANATNNLLFKGNTASVEVIIGENKKIIVTIPEVNVAPVISGTALKFKAALYETN